MLGEAPPQPLDIGRYDRHVCAGEPVAGGASWPGPGRAAEERRVREQMLEAVRGGPHLITQIGASEPRRAVAGHPGGGSADFSRTS